MKHTEIDTAHVLHSYGLALAEKQHRTCDEGHLPFPKDVIKSAIAHYMRQEQDDQVVRHLAFAYRLLAEFQQLSDDERHSVEMMESCRDIGDSSVQGSGIAASREARNGGFHDSLQIRITGAVYDALRDRVGEESEQLQAELRTLRAQ